MPLVGVARSGHPLFRGRTDGRVDVRRFAEAGHIGISRLGKRLGPIDGALADLGLRRRIAVVVPSHTSAMMLARDTDLVALSLADWLPGTIAALGLRTFPVPLDRRPSTSEWPGIPATRPTTGTVGSASGWRPPSWSRRGRGTTAPRSESRPAGAAPAKIGCRAAPGPRQSTRGHDERRQR
ncbi:hypothetical protein ACIRSU_00855 [Streptomyces sp. NPDC101160]|uniref:hypothetical protein n=1 Tax=Streptomyces sp. NPDC101160 TaxID=3366118 RepID=UPI0037F86604